MPVYFFDTSALVKRYHLEAGSEMVNSIMENPEGLFTIASITISEFVSAFRRKLNEGVISEEDLKLCISEFAKEIISSFLVIDLERSHIHKSISLILKHNLRTLDSLQLAVFLDLQPVDPIMVTSDEALWRAVISEGYPALKP